MGHRISFLEQGSALKLSDGQIGRLFRSNESSTG